MSSRFVRTCGFSDGTAFTSADVLFSFAAVYYDTVVRPLADVLRVGGKPMTVVAKDDLTVEVTFPEPFSPGIRILSNLPILPKHRLGRPLPQAPLPRPGPSRPRPRT